MKKDLPGVLGFAFISCPVLAFLIYYAFLLLKGINWGRFLLESDLNLKRIIFNANFMMATDDISSNPIFFLFGCVVVFCVEVGVILAITSEKKQATS